MTDELQRLSDNATAIWAGTPAKRELLPITAEMLAEIVEGLRKPYVSPFSAGLLAAASRYEANEGNSYQRDIDRLAENEPFATEDRQ